MFTGPDTRPALADCTAEPDDDHPAAEILPNLIQLIESELPLGEAENYDIIFGNYLFCQIHSLASETLECLFCRGGISLINLADLRRHYQDVHGLSVRTSRADIRENVIGQVVEKCSKKCVHKRHGEEVLTLHCSFCENVRFRNVTQMKVHYYKEHRKVLAMRRRYDVSVTRNYFYCSFCSEPSVDFYNHTWHMRVYHKKKTFVCRHCTYCTPNPSLLRIHVQQRHAMGSLEETLQCPICSLEVQGEVRLTKHILMRHVVQTGPNFWTCAECLRTYFDPYDLMQHLPYCPKLKHDSEEVTYRSSNVFNCHLCPVKSVTVEEVQDHVYEEDHSEERVSKYYSNLEDTRTCDPEMIDLRTCFLCLMRFPTVQMCSVHLDYVHKTWVVKESIDDSEAESFSEGQTTANNDEVNHNTQEDKCNSGSEGENNLVSKIEFALEHQQTSLAGFVEEQLSQQNDQQASFRETDEATQTRQQVPGVSSHREDVYYQSAANNNAEHPQSMNGQESDHHQTGHGNGNSNFQLDLNEEGGINGQKILDKRINENSEHGYAVNESSFPRNENLNEPEFNVNSRQMQGVIKEMIANGHLVFNNESQCTQPEITKLIEYHENLNEEQAFYQRFNEKAGNGNLVSDINFSQRALNSENDCNYNRVDGQSIHNPILQATNGNGEELRNVGNILTDRNVNINREQTLYQPTNKTSQYRNVKDKENIYSQEAGNYENNHNCTSGYHQGNEKQTDAKRIKKKSISGTTNVHPNKNSEFGNKNKRDHKDLKKKGRGNGGKYSKEECEVPELNLQRSRKYAEKSPTKGLEHKDREDTRGPQQVVIEERITVLKSKSEWEAIKSYRTPGEHGVQMEDSIVEKEMFDIGYPEKIGHYCHLCDQMINKFSLFYAHMRYFHQLVSRFQCVICKKTFNSSMDFREHAFNVHNQNSSDNCRLCDMTFGDLEDKQRHCKSTFHKNRLKNVVVTYGRSCPRNYKCRICNSFFGLYSLFAHHMEMDRNCSKHFDEGRHDELPFD